MDTKEVLWHLHHARREVSLAMDDLEVIDEDGAIDLHDVLVSMGRAWTEITDKIDDLR